MTRICRFNAGRLGLLDGDSIVDVTAALSALSAVRWPFPLGDLLISNLSSIVAASTTLLDRGPRLPVDRVCFLSPVANPSKIIAAPVNYLRHQAVGQSPAILDGINLRDQAVNALAHLRAKQ